MEYVNQTLDFSIEGPSVITLGKFDGLHRGHELLMKELQEQKDWLKKTFTNKGKMGKFDKLVEDMFMNWC